MRFVVDAQLPKALSDFLNKNGHDSIHTLELPDRNTTKDSQIIKKLIEENRILITKDGDFMESVLLKAEPKKLITVRTGNIANKNLIQIFEKNLAQIKQMMSRSNLIEVNSTQIVEHR